MKVHVGFQMARAQSIRQPGNQSEMIRFGCFLSIWRWNHWH